MEKKKFRRVFHFIILTEWNSQLYAYNKKQNVKNRVNFLENTFTF